MNTVKPLRIDDLRQAMKELGIVETILTTDEVAAIAGLMHKKDGKPYSRRTVSNWLRDGKLKGARDLGPAWAIPISALDPDRFSPPARGRPTEQAAQTPADRQTLRDEYHTAIRHLCIWSSGKKSEFPLDFRAKVWAKAWAISTHPDTSTFVLFDIIDTARDLLEWGLSEGYYQPGNIDQPEWHTIDKLLERTHNK